MKNPSKNGVKMGRHVGIDVLWILVNVGGKLGGKMEQRSTQEGIEKAMENWKAPKLP